MSYIDSSGVIINEITEEQLKAQETLPPNQYWLTPEEDFATVGLPLGMIIPSAIIQNSSHLHLLDGTSLPSAGIYAKFYEWAVTNSENVPSCTEEEYEADLSTYGQCGKFVIGADYIKLPTITEFIASSNGGKQIGLAELDSFKNHTHGIKVRSGSSAGSYNGFPTMSANSGTTQNVSTGVVYESNTGGDETKPKNIRYPYYIVVATGTKTDVEVNIDNIASDLNNKADLDLGNINPSSSAKKYFALYPMPSTSYETISSIPATITSSTSYNLTAPATGWYSVTGLSNSTDHNQVTFTNSTTDIKVRSQISKYADCGCYAYIPARKGDAVVFNAQNVKSVVVKFHYAEGEL